MKFIHNDKVSLGWAIFVELVAHGFFAFQAFLLGGFLGEIALQSIFGARVGTQIGAWGLALFMFGAAMQAFVLGEYMKEHVQSFVTSRKADGSYMRSWQHIRWIVGAMELSSLAFRCFVVLQAGDYRQAAIVALFGILLLYYAYAQAKVIHASVNRDVAYDIARTNDYAARSIQTDSLRYIPKMSITQKQRWLDGDVGVIDEMEGSREDKRNEKLRVKQTRDLDKQREEQRSQHEYERNRGIADRLLHRGRRDPEQPAPDYPFLDAQSSQADHLSNGRR